MRTDAKRNLKKVATEILKDPLQTQREIASKIDIGKSSTNRAIIEMGQNGTIDRTATIISIEEKDLEIVTLGQKIILEKLKDKEVLKKTGLGELSTALEKSQKRYSILAGETTDEQGGDKLIQSILDGITNKSKGIDNPEIS